MASEGGVIRLPEFKVKYRDVFSLRNLYIMLHEMLLEEGWKGVDGNDDHEDIEILYSENVYQRGIHRGGKELWFWWRANKFAEGKFSGYIKNFLDIDAHVVIDVGLIAYRRVSNADALRHMRPILLNQVCVQVLVLRILTE